MSIQPSILPRIHRILARCTAGQITLICLTLEAGAAVLDAVSGPDFITMPFYCIPIVIAAWYVGFTLGAFNALLSTGVALGIQLGGMVAVANPYRVTANSMVRLFAFVLVSLFTIQVRDAVARASERRRGMRRPRTISSGEFQYVTLEELAEPYSARRPSVPSEASF